MPTRKAVVYDVEPVLTPSKIQTLCIRLYWASVGK